MMMRSGVQLGYFSLHPGAGQGYGATSPNYMNRQGRVRRLLFHSSLDETVQYPYLPDKTTNFSYDVLPRVDFDQAKTLNSNVTQQWAAVAADVVVSEFWEGDLSHKWSFLHKLYEFWRQVPGIGEHLIWRPLDLTDKIYRVQILNMLLGGETFNPTYVGKDKGHERWMTATLEVQLKLMAVFPPSVTIYASGTLGTTGLS